MTTREEEPYRPVDAALAGRLYNWKFEQAKRCLRDDHPEGVRDLVTALGDTFANPGWFMGGSLEVIIQAALSTVYADLLRLKQEADSEGGQG